MNKRYQVFISSTYEDLKNARSEVSQALLETDCFPASMELFPAADDEQMIFIKRIIDECDYYLLILAGRYGSIHPEYGVSYTELEYDYAIEIKKPVIVLIHRNIDSLPVISSEKTDEGREKLLKFRQNISTGRLIKYWDNPIELQKEAILALLWAKRHRPAIGWARADRIASKDAELEISKLHNEIQTLRSKSLVDGHLEGIELFIGNLNDEIEYSVYHRNEKHKFDLFYISESKIALFTLMAIYNERRDSYISSIIKNILMNLEHKNLDIEKYSIGIKKSDVDRILLKLESNHVINSDNEIADVGISTHAPKVSVLTWNLPKSIRPWVARRRLELDL